MLAPTDPALVQAVVSIIRILVRLRHDLNVESGLHDGIAVPIFTAAFIIAGVAAHDSGASTEGGGIGSFAFQQLTLGPLAGVIVAWPAGWLVERSVVKRTSTSTTVQIAGLAIAIAAFAVASFIGGNGLIAAFVAGLVIGNTTRTACKALLEFAEDEGQLLMLIAFLIFGAVMLPLALAQASVQTILYAVLSLTIVRLLPVLLSTFGSGLRLPSVLFLGWFGPRGLATVLFALFVYEAHDLPGREQVFSIASLTVAVSIVVHGVTAVPFSAWYGRWHDRLRTDCPDASECQPAPALPTRFRSESESAVTEQEAS